jgi:hypothetical protein
MHCIAAKHVANVRFGSKADIARCQADVRFTPKKRTLIERVGMSALCHNRTHAAQQKALLFDHLVGGGGQ